MSVLNPKPVYRKDYQLSKYLIKTTELVFELLEHETIVSSKISFYKNKEASGLQSRENRLFLNGVDIELISISINGAEPAYETKKDGIELRNLEDEFIVDIKTRIHPEKNTSLNGLYKSSGNYCTQCEAHGFRNITYYLDRPDVLSVFTTTIRADDDKYPTLLSNGNLVNKSPGSATWHDPAPKPCYLFALVAGKFSVLEDSYKTK
ncbi:MAG: aminopeptidase N, partial [Gammaproteobacteria bacterium]|nr:aminopeptidase N [Gammaproteobacteria bacterium]